MVSLTTSSLICHMATTRPNNIVDSGVLQISMSDYYLVYCLRKLNGARRKDQKVIKESSMKSFDEAPFLADVSLITWDRVVSRPIDMNVLVDDWHNLFSMVIDRHAPIKSMRISENYYPWINKALKGLIGERDTRKNEQVNTILLTLWSPIEEFKTRLIP